MTVTESTATGLSPGTSYTWTLTAVYNNWKSAAVSTSATTFQVVHATLAGSVTDGTSGSKSSTVTSSAQVRGSVAGRSRAAISGTVARRPSATAITSSYASSLVSVSRRPFTP